MSSKGLTLLLLLGLLLTLSQGAICPPFYYQAFHIDVCEANEIVFMHITYDGFYLGDNDG